MWGILILFTVIMALGVLLSTIVLAIDVANQTRNAGVVIDAAFFTFFSVMSVRYFTLILTISAAKKKEK